MQAKDLHMDKPPVPLDPPAQFSPEKGRLRKNAPEPVGKRIARLRSERGWTQQALAARLAISRVAVSHIEMDLSLPSERTVTLLAGLFKLSPYELVKETTYPRPKTERLPVVACSYTQLEVDLVRMENDLEWLERLTGSAQRARWEQEVREKWMAWLSVWSEECSDEGERELIACARKRLEDLQG